MNLTPSTKAGALYILPAIAVLSIWWVLLFVENSPGVTPLGTLRFVLTEGPQRHWFYWLIALPILCALLTGAYWSRLTRNRSGAVGLFVVGAVVSLAAWFTVTWEIAMFATLPLLYGFRCIKEQRRHQ
jgi:hypothetical protein